MKRQKTTAISVITFCMLLLAISGGPIVTASSDPIRVYYDNEQLETDVLPVIKQGRVHVPLHPLAQALSLTTNWDSVSKSVELRSDDTFIRLNIGSTTAYQHDEAVLLDSAPFIMNNRTMVPIRWISEALKLDVYWHKPSRSVLVDSTEVPLPLIGSYNSLKKLIDQSIDSDSRMMKTSDGQIQTTMENEAVDTVAGSDSAPSSEKSDDVSSTNVQVDGVDEADIVKTDGTYIYHVNQDRLLITQAQPVDNMKLVKTLSFTEDNFRPQEIYLDGTHLIVIGSGSKYQPYTSDTTMERSDATTEKRLSMPHSSRIVMAKVYDIQQGPEQITLTRELEMEGHYISSRKIGTALYMVTNQYIDTYRIMNEKDEVPTPGYRDSLTADSLQPIAYDKIYYFPDHVQANYLLVGGVDLAQPEQPFDVSAYLGGGQKIYSSTNHLYTAVTHTEYQDLPLADQADTAEPAENTEPAPNMMPKSYASPINTTKIYKFALQHGKVKYQTEGQVPGTVLNQFSMDEHQGNFRIATTSGNMWRNDEDTSKNNLYVLDPDLNTIGALEGLAPGERIYSARFMGDRAYMVTFRTVDPLFVVDLQDPEKPTLLGELKIPGFSDYLHPYDENHLIGFGKDTIEVEQKDSNGDVVRVTAFDVGMKLSLFDVSDVSNPIEKHIKKIGDRGTSSEVLNNHKALLYSKEKNMMAFPVTVMTVKDGETTSRNPDIPPYGHFTFQGAHVYDISIENGFSLRGKVTHLTDEMLDKAGDRWYQSDFNIQRMLYIEDTLYTLSPGKIKANDLESLAEQGSLDFKK